MEKKYRINVYTSLLLALLFINACSHQDQLNKSNPSLFIGAYWVDDILVAYPTLLSFNEGKTTLYNNTGMPIDTSTLIDSTLCFKNHEYFIFDSKQDQLKIYDRADRKKLRRYRDNIVFRKVSGTKKKYNKNLKEVIKKTPWHYQTQHSTPNEDLVIKNNLVFTEDTLYHHRLYSYDLDILHAEVELFLYNIFEIEGSVFLSIIDINEPKENPLPIYEVVEYSSKQIKWINHQALKPQLETLSVSKIPVEDIKRNLESANQFNLCYSAEQSLYYYNGGYYKDGASGFLRDYKQLVGSGNKQSSSQSGYIIFQFKVNCEKELGRYGLIQMDLDFHSTKFEPSLVKNLFTIVNNSSSKWNLPLENVGYCYVGQIKDVKSFVMFKVQNGNVTEVLP